MPELLLNPLLEDHCDSTPLTVVIIFMLLGVPCGFLPTEYIFICDFITLLVSKIFSTFLLLPISDSITDEESDPLGNFFWEFCFWFIVESYDAL